LTKLLACPGLRIGYVLCPDAALARRVADRRPQWAVNGLAADALPDLLASADLVSWASAVRDLRHRLVSMLRRAGLQPQASDANWVLVHAPGLRERLGARAVCVRDCASFGLPGTVRIAVPDEAGLARLQDALLGTEPRGER
jgi:histidinol-phosphate/aromatic aminotransferase/cobyric acid decarboxylase-like protein